MYWCRAYRTLIGLSKSTASELLTYHLWLVASNGDAVNWDTFHEAVLHSRRVYINDSLAHLQSSFLPHSTSFLISFQHLFINTPLNPLENEHPVPATSGLPAAVRPTELL